MEEYVTRTEFERFKQEVGRRIDQRHTDEIPAFNVNVGSQDVLDRLDKIERQLEDGQKELKTVSDTWLDTLQEHYTEHKSAINDVQTVQKGHAKFFEEHGKRLAATATKDDVSKLETRFDEHGKRLAATATKDDISELKTRFDEQGKKVDQMFQILQKLQEKLGG